MFKTITDTPQSPEDTKTETIEQIAEDVAAKIANTPISKEQQEDFDKFAMPNSGGVRMVGKLSLRDAAEYGKMTYNKLTKLVRNGVIKTVPGNTPKAKMILASEIDNYLSTQKQAT